MNKATEERAKKLLAQVSAELKGFEDADADTTIRIPISILDEMEDLLTSTLQRGRIGRAVRKPGGSKL
ncbi:MULTISPECIES: hypothetical protein [Stenotrophomonas maltophilia group]|uniref:hypothetical protein n=1 Tax=Stenotrophomonas TaxID=40323 RepID=UPI0013DA4822|nr:MULTISPECIES: hypothetical protein [Stenotrophomonas maltophilia group]MBN5116773.1 hypothetical protein [Stenotrophomonas maltophilia]MCZ7845876.1 hypothetical protein [Stenotrophomonas maltophilia]